MGQRFHPAAAQALAIVAANVPLPTETQKALRLTCQSTRAAMDQEIKELCICVDAAEGLRPTGSLLTSGLSLLKIDEPTDRFFQDLSVSNACTIAINNRNTLEHLFVGVYKSRTCRAALAMLGIAGWPRLRSLTMPCVPGAFKTFLLINLMPKLTDLHLRGSLSSADVDVLRSATHFPSTVESLTLELRNVKKLHRSIGQLLAATTQLRRLTVFESDRLLFLHTADLSLPNLEILEFNYDDNDAYGVFVCLRPITLHPWPRLRALTISGRACCPRHLETLLSNTNGAFSALESLSLTLDSNGWGVLSKMALNLKSLALHGGLPDDDGIAAVGMALTRLPALESLQLMPMGVEPEYEMGVDGDEAFPEVLSGPPLRRLRRLETGGFWADSDDSLDALIAAADKIPHLEELVMGDSYISPIGFAALAAAGRAGRWPHLNLFQIRYFCIGDIEQCRRLLQEVWPGLELKITR